MTAAPWAAVENPDSAPPGRLGSIPSAHGVAPYGMGGSFRPLPALCGVGCVPRSVLRALAPPCRALSQPFCGSCSRFLSAPDLPCRPPAPAAPAGGSRGAPGLRPWGLPPPARLRRASPRRPGASRSTVRRPPILPPGQGYASRRGPCPVALDSAGFNGRTATSRKQKGAKQHDRHEQTCYRSI